MTDYEQVLFVCRSVDLFRIPPRAASTGHKSGEWRVQDKVFTARCRVVARGSELEVRLEDPNTCAWVLGRASGGSRPAQSVRSACPALPSSCGMEKPVAVRSEVAARAWAAREGGV